MISNPKSEIRDSNPSQNSTTKTQNTFILRPCVPLVLALMAGLVLGAQFFESFLSVRLWVLFSLLFALPIVILLFPSIAIWTGCAFFIVTGISLMTLLSPRANTLPVPSFLLNNQFQHFSGVIIEEPVTYPDKTRFIIRLTSYSQQGQDRPIQGVILLTVKHSSPIMADTPLPPPSPTSGKGVTSFSSPLLGENGSGGEKGYFRTLGAIEGFDQGDPVRFVCRLRLIEGYHNPGGYDFEKRMAEKGVRVSGFIPDPELLILSGPNQRSWPWQRLSTLRKWVSDIIDSNISIPYNGLAQALITGDQTKIPREIQEAFSRAGVSHLLAFSGLNLTLVGGLTYYVFRFLLSLSETILLSINARKWALVGTFFPVLGYAMLAGMSPSAARALFMVSMVILALLLQRYSDLLNSLAFAALVLLLISPESLFLPSFQLSFVSVWAIGYLLPRIWNPANPWKIKTHIRIRRFLFYLWGTFCVSLVCQLATAPFVAWWFHQVSLVGLLSNLVLVPLSGALATPIGLLALLSAPIFSPLSSLLFWIMHLLLQWTLWLTKVFADLPFAFLIMPRPGYVEIGLFFLTLVLSFNWRKIPKPAWWISFSFLGMLLFFFSPQIRDFFSPSFRITFLDVGHGNSALIEFPEGEKMLIDGGGSFNPEFDLGERVVAPFLWDKKITCLDVVVMTHPHPDHINGLPFILSKFKVKEIWTNGQQVESDAFERMGELIRQKKIPVVYPSPGWSRWVSDVQVVVLHTSMKSSLREGDSSKIWHSQNNDSLVLQLNYKNQRILLPADIEAETERILLNKHLSLKSHILQVPHHGSLTSSSIPFIEAVQPCYAVISQRPSPRLPLPHPEIIRRYQVRGVTLLRTDQDGAVTFSLTKDKWEVESYLKGPLARSKK